MIPKKIHFCWLSGDEYPPLIKHCIETWHKILPDYEIIKWDTERFDINSVPWVKDAYEAKKYAFAADYIRVYALYTEGGIYLDSDVEMIKSFNNLLKYKSFIGFEAATNDVEAAIMGAERGMEWCKKALEFYERNGFSMEFVREQGLLAPKVVKKALTQSYPSLKIEPVQEEFNFNNSELLLCPTNYFSPIKYDIEKSYSSGKKNLEKYKRNPQTYCIHRFNAAWAQKPALKIRLWEYFKKKAKEIF